MLNLDRLRVLQAVVRHESIHAAAIALHVSPSAISQQIAKLEREVRHDLVDRDGRGIRLTHVALLLSERASEILEAVESLEGDLDSFHDLVAGPVRIAAFATAARAIGPVLLQRLRDRHPELQACLVEQEPDSSLLLLVNRYVDVVILHDWFNAPLAMPAGVSRLALFDDIADVALPIGHRFAGRRSLQLSDLADESWVTWPSGTICHEWLLHTYRSEGIEPKIAHTAAEHATQLAFVGAELGPAIIPRLGRGVVPVDVRIVRIEPTMRRHVFMAWRTNGAQRPNIVAVREALVGVASKVGRTVRTPSSSAR